MLVSFQKIYGGWAGGLSASVFRDCRAVWQEFYGLSYEVTRAFRIHVVNEAGFLK